LLPPPARAGLESAGTAPDGRPLVIRRPGAPRDPRSGARRGRHSGGRGGRAAPSSSAPPLGSTRLTPAAHPARNRRPFL